MLSFAVALWAESLGASEHSGGWQRRRTATCLRLLKASSSRRYEQSRGFSAQQRGPGEPYGGRFERQIPATTTPTTGAPVPPPTVPPTGGNTETLGAERR